MNTIFILVLLASVCGTAYALLNYEAVIAIDEGTNEMVKVAKIIRSGANQFLISEYKVIAPIAILIALFFALSMSWHSGVSFIIGAIMSGLAGLFGMKASTYANVRVTNTAKTTGKTGPTLQVALKGGSVMGLSVASFSLIGLLLVFIFFDSDLAILEATPNWLGFEFIPMTQNISSYALGCSIIAMFNRIGGGIYTKGADVGADLVGKTELGLPEDDPRNPGVIADCVGDNVGDTAGLGSDILESNVGAIMSACIFAFSLYTNYQAKNAGFGKEILEKLYLYPIAFSAIGLIACIISLMYIFSKKDADEPHEVLNNATYLAAVISSIGNFAMTAVIMWGQDFEELPFRVKGISPFFAALCGILCGVLLGTVTEYYTSYDFKPTRTLANYAKEGPAIYVSQQDSLGMKSTLPSVMLIGITILVANFFAGFYGMAMMAVGMLSFVGITVSVDTYGPISDNAGGIAEMTKQPEEVRKITDRLDAEGNTTAAIGKGFAIGSATSVSICQMAAYLFMFTPAGTDISLNVMDPLIFVGLLIGSAFAWYFSGYLNESVGDCARSMVDEIRRQFKDDDIRNGEKDPDYNACIRIATEGALRKMRYPAIIALITPLIAGFIMGPEFVGGMLIGSTLASVALAIYCGNSGGAADNGKKYVEAKGLKGTDIHYAAVVGDTVGDPKKDTVGPSLDIFIKIMNTVSMVAVPIFARFNFVDFLSYTMLEK